MKALFLQRFFYACNLDISILQAALAHLDISI
jgi:hypothetical protein